MSKAVSRWGSREPHYILVLLNFGGALAQHTLITRGRMIYTLCDVYISAWMTGSGIVRRNRHRPAIVEVPVRLRSPPLLFLENIREQSIKKL